MLLFEQHPVLYPVQISRFKNTGALSAAEYGRLAVWAHSLPFSGLSAASTAAGWCISAVFVLCGVGVVLCANTCGCCVDVVRVRNVCVFYVRVLVCLVWHYLYTACELAHLHRLELRR